jgi:two-component system sensor histidine kinase KdpD
MATKLETLRLGLELTHQAAIAEAAKSAEQFKTTLLAEVSHELRTPLSSIKGFASTLLATDVTWDCEQQRDFIKEIVVESDRLDALIGDLLDMSRLENGQLRLHREPTDLVNLLEKLHPRLERSVERHRFEISVTKPIPEILVDRLRIEQVISNLIDNAAKFSPPGSVIKLTLTTGAEEIVVAVTDEGPGIPAGDLERIFQRFNRGSTQGTETPGLGLGLAISRGIIEAHCGQIRVENNLGAGATFRFTLPLTAKEDDK